MNYYNDIDPYVCQWLENLILSDLIPYGDVDGRSIADVSAADVRGYTQAHFFCGIAGWPLALKLAGWPETRRIWTGSCPCQPFSQAGNGAGFADDRHLWPHFERLIRECRPPVVTGEQVASKDAEPWLDHVLADLEALGYAGAALAFPSAGIGAPHIRDRTYWLGYANDAGPQGHAGHDGAARREGPPGPTAAAGVPRGLGNTHGQPGERRTGSVSRTQAALDRARVFDGREHHGPADASEGLGERPGPTNGFWRDADWLSCRDRKWRPVEPGTFPLADGIPSRVGRLRAYGNAINPQQGAEFMRAVMECMP